MPKIDQDTKFLLGGLVGFMFLLTALFIFIIMLGIVIDMWRGHISIARGLSLEMLISIMILVVYYIFREKPTKPTRNFFRPTRKFYVKTNKPSQEKSIEKKLNEFIKPE